MQLFVDSASIAGLPPIKIPLHFPIWNPDPGRFDFLPDGGQYLLIMTGLRFMTNLQPHTAVFFKQPCADFFFLSLLQISELFVCPKQPSADPLMVFAADLTSPHFIAF